MLTLFCVQVYNNELESVKAFENFEEQLHTFTFLRGKKVDDEEDDFHRISGKFKVS